MINPENQNEITLVDGIRSLLNRRFLFFSVFFFSMLLVVFIALKKGGNQETTNDLFPEGSPGETMVSFSSIYSVGFTGNSNSLLDPFSGIETLIREVYYPKKSETKRDVFPIIISYEMQKPSNILKLQTVIKEKDWQDDFDNRIYQMHEKILNKLLERHDTFYKLALEQIMKSGSNTIVIPSRIVSIAMKDKYIQPESKKISRVLIIVLGFFGSLLVGLASVFLVELYVSIRKELNGENE